MSMLKNWIDIVKESRDYYKLLENCIHAENWSKASWVCENKIMPLQEKHPFLCWIGSWLF